VDAANQAFLTAMHWSAAGGVVAALVGVLVALAWLPGRRTTAPAPVVEEVTPELVEARAGRPVPAGELA
jgi:hypothetical protein